MRDLLELIYFISGPLLVIASGLILLQIKIAKKSLLASNAILDQEKKDLKLRSKRDSIDISCQQIKMYFNDIVPLYWELAKQIEVIQIKGLKINSFTRKDLLINEDEFNNWGERIIQDESKINQIISLINKMDTFSMFFTKGIADESVAFNSISISYCEIVEKLYSLICLYRKDTREFSYYNNLIELYRIWKDRINSIEKDFTKDKLEKELNDLKSQIDKMSERQNSRDFKRIKPLGTEDN